MRVAICAPLREVKGGFGGVTLEHADNMVKVGVGLRERTRRNGRNGIFGSTLAGLNSCARVDLEDGLCREVRAVPHTGIQLLC